MDLSLSQHWNLEELFLLGTLVRWDGPGECERKCDQLYLVTPGQGAGLVVPYKKEAYGKGRRYLIGKKIRNCCFLEGCVH